MISSSRALIQLHHMMSSFQTDIRCIPILTDKSFKLNFISYEGGSKGVFFRNLLQHSNCTSSMEIRECGSTLYIRLACAAPPSKQTSG